MKASDLHLIPQGLYGCQRWVNLNIKLPLVDNPQCSMSLRPHAALCGKLSLQGWQVSLCIYLLSQHLQLSQSSIFN